MKAIYEDRPQANNGHNKAGYRNLYLHIALGIYIGGLALTITLTITSLLLGAFFITAQEKALRSQLKQFEKNIGSLQLPDFDKSLNTPAGRKPAVNEVSYEQAQLICTGYKNRATFLAENLKNEKLTENYGSFAPMKGELDSLITTIANECGGK